MPSQPKESDVDMASEAESEMAGNFASFEVDETDSNFGWKILPYQAVKDDDGTRAHAWCERVVLEYLSAQDEMKEYVPAIHKAVVDKEAGVVKLKMKYVRGPSLLEWVQTPKLCTADNAMKISCRLVEFFAHLHRRFGISHGDVKPDNVIIDAATGKPWIIDWGAARWGEKYTSKCDFIQGNIQCSSPQFLEVLADRELNDGDEEDKKRMTGATYDSIKNDVFGLGMLLTYIWTAVGSKGTEPEGVFGSAWDQGHDDDEMLEGIMEEEECSREGAMMILQAHGAEEELPRVLENVPEFWADWIVEFVCGDEKERKSVYECYEALHKGECNFKKGKKKIEGMKYMEPKNEKLKKKRASIATYMEVQDVSQALMEKSGSAASSSSSSSSAAGNEFSRPFTSKIFDNLLVGLKSGVPKLDAALNEVPKGDVVLQKFVFPVAESEALSKAAKVSVESAKSGASVKSGAGGKGKKPLKRTKTNDQTPNVKEGKAKAPAPMGDITNKVTKDISNSPFKAYVPPGHELWNGSQPLSVEPKSKKAQSGTGTGKRSLKRNDTAGSVTKGMGALAMGESATKKRKGQGVKGETLTFD